MLYIYPSMVNYLSERALRNLRYYKYSAIDRSPLSNYVLRHYWNWAVTLFPMWMAPNLITLIGFGFIWINLFLILIFMPDLQGPGPPWIYFSFAIGIWLYSTFDNVDGKQARRTGTSSPLGELFDHGCDALNCSVGGIVQAASLGLGCTWYTFAVTFMSTIILLTPSLTIATVKVILPKYLYTSFIFVHTLIATLNFYASTWEEFHTGTLYLGYVNGPTEGLTIACIMSIISGINGPQFWHQPAANLIPEFLAIFPIDYTLIDYCLIGLLLLLFGTQVPMSIYAVYKSILIRRATLLQASKISRPLYSFKQSVAQVLPMCLFLLCNGIWLISPYSVALRRHIILFTVANGIVFGRMATKIILAHVTMMEFPMNSTGLLIPLGLGTILVTIPYFTGIVILSPSLESIYIWLYFFVALINYIHWALLVINKFCDHLGIHCLTIRKSNAHIEEECHAIGDHGLQEDSAISKTNKAQMHLETTEGRLNYSFGSNNEASQVKQPSSSGHSTSSEFLSEDRRRLKDIKKKVTIGC